MNELNDVTDHKCSQGVTLAIICEKLESIESSIQKIEEAQKEYMKKTNEIVVSNARYPTSDEVGIMIKTLERHNTYFTIFGTALIAAWGLLLFLADKVWLISTS